MAKKEQMVKSCGGIQPPKRFYELGSKIKKETTAPRQKKSRAKPATKGKK